MTRTLRILRSHPGDEEFHRTRRMFAFVGNRLYLAPKNCPNSHIEWFAAEGWLTSGSEAFMESTVRGFAGGGRLHFYSGIGFAFDARVEASARQMLPGLVAALDLPTMTQVWLGPRDAIVHGTAWPQRYLGTLGELLV